MPTRAGLLIQRATLSGLGSIDITPEGYETYAAIVEEAGSPVAHLEATVLEYLDSREFQERFSDAFKDWSTAATLLWSEEVSLNLSTIGHLCREAMQNFAAALVGAPTGTSPDPDRPKTVSRIKEALRGVPGKTHKAFLEALVAYWGTVSDLAQRQEHAGHKEGEPIGVDDARRLVFQTAVVMFEVAKSIRSA